MRCGLNDIIIIVNTEVEEKVKVQRVNTLHQERAQRRVVPVGDTQLLSTSLNGVQLLFFL